MRSLDANDTSTDKYTQMGREGHASRGISQVPCDVAAQVEERAMTRGRGQVL